MAASLRPEVRPSDSSFVERVTRVEYDRPVDGLSLPDGCWDIVFIRGLTGTVAFQTGLSSRPWPVRHAPGERLLTISFKPGVFMPRAPASRILDGFLVHPTPSSRSVSIVGHTVEIPTFDNAEGFVENLARRGLLRRDEIVESVVVGRPWAISPRSVQRHFLSALGMTPKQFAQVQRACRAVEQLEAGRAIATVATELGYSDQAHMTRALKRIMGRTPGKIARDARP